MIIYNITTQVSWEINDRWRQWFLTKHLPSILSSGVFYQHQFSRILELDDDFGPTYTLQLYVNENCSIIDYRIKHLPVIDEQSKLLWGNNAYSFSSLMEVIN